MLFKSPISKTLSTELNVNFDYMKVNFGEIVSELYS